MNYANYICHDGNTDPSERGYRQDQGLEEEGNIFKVDLIRSEAFSNTKT